MVQIGFKCNRGVVRQNNEDACFVIPRYDVYLVADGVGGNASGELASSTAVEMIADFVNEYDISQSETPDEIFGFLTEAIDIANAEIYRLGREVPENRGMATTVVAAYLNDGAAYIANIGDSRAYIYRNGKLKQVTKDHTYVNELVEKGLITEREALTHHQKNVITKALGAEPTAEPDFYRVNLRPGDILMLCSDGLYGEVSDERIAEMMGMDLTMNELTNSLVDEANNSGGRDNITVVCVKF